MRATLPTGMTHAAIEARNLYTIANVIVQAALGRCESRGAHFRSDFPRKDETAKHSILLNGELHFAA
jgi:L-aspartate oxidase